jgi:hypothetical protein
MNLGLIFLEDIREAQKNFDDTHEPDALPGWIEEHVIAHEIGHQGAGGDELHEHSGLMSLEDFAGTNKYDPRTLVIFRSGSEF